MRTVYFEPVGFLIVCATDSLALETWAVEKCSGKKTMYFEPEGLSPGCELCDLWASVSSSVKDGEWVMNGSLTSLLI